MQKILVLNPVNAHGDQVNDFGLFTAKRLIRVFGNGTLIFYTDIIREHGIDACERLIRDRIRKDGVSILFFSPNGDNYELSIEFLQSLRRELGVRVVLWVYDDEMIFDTLTKYYSQVADAAVTTDYFATFQYRRLGVPAFYFFSSYSKEDFHPTGAERDLGVSFVGDCTKADRMEMIEFLRSKGIEVSAFGKGTSKGFVSKAEMSAIFSRTKVNLNFTKVDKHQPLAWYLEENSLTNRVRQAKGRPMEIAMTDSFCLSESAPSLGVTFEIGSDLDIFTGKEELYEKVVKYLGDDDLRSVASHRAYQKAITQFEVDVFLPKLCDEICQAFVQPIDRSISEKIYKDTVFKRNHLIRLTTLMIFQMSHFRLQAAFGTFRKMFQYGFVAFIGGLAKGLRVSFTKAFAIMRNS